MRMVFDQFELFDEAPGYRQSPRPTLKKRPRAPSFIAPSFINEHWDAERAAKRLPVALREVFRKQQTIVRRCHTGRTTVAKPRHSTPELRSHVRSLMTLQIWYLKVLKNFVKPSLLA